MILSFSTKFKNGRPTGFVEKILSGKKIHSIRIDPHGRWKEGRVIHYATGARTKFYYNFAMGLAASVFTIRIYPENRGIRLFDSRLDGVGMTEPQIATFIRNDGFDDPEDFWQWFNKPFKGRVIRWEPSSVVKR